MVTAIFGIRESEIVQATSTCPSCQGANVAVVLTAPDRFHARPDVYRLMRCSDCSYVWLKEPPKPEEMGRHYGALYDSFIARAGEHSPGRWQSRQKAIFPHKQRGDLLDLGCSSGSFLDSMKGDAWRLHGIEMSSKAAQAAREKTGAEIFCGDILSAPFPEESFEVITCFDVLEHVYEPQKVLAKISQWLKPGGIFYTLVPNIDSGEARVFKTYWYGLELPRHLSHFCPASLRHLAQSVGLRELSIETHRNSAMEYSLRYLNTDVLRRFGVSRPPLAAAGEPTLAWKVFRKALRWTVYRAFYQIISLAGPGESIHAIFQKHW
jgi:2-polyprenyl-3-methyl-5-hydroxy-6-metoxy-1,4-benzoquinol methylase